VHNAEAFEILLESAIIPGGNEEAAIQSLGHSCLLLCQKEKFGEANSLIASTILPLCEKHGLHYFRCYFLLKQAMIYLASSPDNPTNALPSLLDCLALSEEQSVDPIHAAALSLLSRVFLEMGNLDRAKATMKAVLPILLKHGHIYFQGQAWLTLAKCSLAEAKGFGKDNDECKDHTPLLLRALSELQRAAIAFENIKDTSPLREVYYLISQVCNAIPEHDDIRDKAARSFIGLNKARVSSLKPTWHDALSDILNYRREKINK
jgi:tetratricopeptide (TPR) repeat protein